ncbi:MULTISPECIES: ribonuclease R [unclassified Guyparkeria]|uniref:ribonuclease R n=1 Tax=unclassified Guyparkeria TaxID=2626246 RepID=UPI000733563D|nr:MULTISPECIES: ribonuclease R [unclassified Guyparkeria]KTG17198.1 exoribonuclease R [Guyparkeria sp. XI15]OAE87168.1 exoribonuclease R [Guyparkeria sp. WRN-7]
MTDSNLEDPNAPREAEKYDNPVASREFLLDLLAKQDGPITLNKLISELGYDGDEERIEGLRRRLRAMERDGQAIRNRRGGYVPVTKAELVRGRVIGHRDGFGFLVPDEGGNDVFLSPRIMRALLHGDRAVVQVVGEDRRGRPEGALVEVIERANAEVVGRLVIEAGVAFVIPDNTRMTQDVLIPMEALGGAKDGQIVRVALVEQPTQRHKPVGKVIEVLGDHMSPGMEIDVAIRAHGIPHEWPEPVKKHVEDMSDQVAEEDKVGRVDLRDVPLVTIDGADSKDLDDAVFCEPTPKGFRLLVAIADVSHYVRIGSALDEEGFRRATSVYFPGRVVPMLPEILSNGLCSVNPDVDRLCLCAEMLINSQGQIIRSRFFEGVMRSHARLTYDNVAAMLLDNDQEERDKHSHVIKPLEALHSLYKVLRAERESRGAIDFDTIETKIVFGENRKIEAIVPYERNDAHKIIEECMIAANVAAGRFLARRKIPSLYRVHDRPGAEKIDDLRASLKEKGLTLGGGDKPTPADFNALIAEAQGRPDFATIQTLLLRSLQQAVYAPDNLGHFGLAHEHYAHFTSPIRRYPDLMVHRAIRHVLRTGSAEQFPYSHEEMLLIGEHCSNNERRADEATRAATDWLKCEFMLDKVGNVYEGRVASVLGFGLFVELKDFFVEGLLHITALKRDFYHFDPVSVSLKGERSGKTYSLNDTIRVRVARVDLDERKIDFMLPDEEEPSDDEGASADESGGDESGSDESRGDEEKSGSGEGGGKKRRPRRRRRRKPQGGGKEGGDKGADQGGESSGDSSD